MTSKEAKPLRTPEDVLRKMLSTPPEPHKPPAKSEPKKGTKSTAHAPQK